MKENDTFDIGFNNMMSSAVEYGFLKRAGKPISKELQDRLNESSNWLNGLTDEEYSRLIR